ncbi:MAG TPA: MlaD family protein [Phycisphaerales bacterium]|nr:MlaD family protein [Phycisphaerales bacterium]
MNRTFLRDLLTGVFALAALGALVFLLIFFGEIAPLADNSYEFRLRVANAGGLDDTSPVRLNGVKVGRVMKAEILPGVQSGAELHLSIQPGINIPRASRISVDRGFVGGSSLDFVTSDLTETQLADNILPEEIVNGGAPGTLIDNIRTLVEGPLQRFSSTADQIDALATEWTQVGKGINELLAPRTLADVENGAEPNVRTTLERIDAAVAGANAWLRDDTLRTRFNALLDKADGVMNEARTLASSWSQTAKTIDGSAREVNAQAARITQNFEQVAQDTRAAVGRVQAAGDQLATLVENVNKGQGTLGQLATNPELYQNLDDASRRLDAALEELRQLIEKYKNEGLRIKL